MISDEMLRKVASEAGKSLAEEYLEPEMYRHDFSPRFERKMRRVLSYGRNPTVYRNLKRVASFFLAILIGGTVWLAADAEARAAFFGWIGEKLQGAYHYYAPELTPNKRTDISYSFPAPPDGYVPYGTYTREGYGSYHFEDTETGNMFSFTYVLDSDTEMFLLTETNDVHNVSVNGQPARFYNCEKEQSGNSLVWTDEETGALLVVDGFFDEDYLIKWAEGIRIKD